MSWEVADCVPVTALTALRSSASADAAAKVTAPREGRAAAAQGSRQQRERTRLPRYFYLATAQHQEAVDVPQGNRCRLGEFAPLQKVVDGYRAIGKRIHRASKVWLGLRPTVEDQRDQTVEQEVARPNRVCCAG